MEYSDYFFNLNCYIHNVSADVSFSFLQIFHVEPAQNLKLNPLFNPPG